MYVVGSNGCSATPINTWSLVMNKGLLYTNEKRPKVTNGTRVNMKSDKKNCVLYYNFRKKTVPEAQYGILTHVCNQRKG